MATDRGNCYLGLLTANHVEGATITQPAGDALADADASRVGTKHLWEAWRAQTNALQRIKFDFGLAKTVSAIGIGGHNLEFNEGLDFTTARFAEDTDSSVVTTSDPTWASATLNNTIPINTDYAGGDKVTFTTQTEPAGRVGLLEVNTNSVLSGATGFHIGINGVDLGQMGNVVRPPGSGISNGGFEVFRVLIDPSRWSGTTTSVNQELSFWSEDADALQIRDMTLWWLTDMPSGTVYYEGNSSGNDLTFDTFGRWPINQSGGQGLPVLSDPLGQIDPLESAARVQFFAPESDQQGQAAMRFLIQEPDSNGDKINVEWNGTSLDVTIGDSNAPVWYGPFDVDVVFYNYLDMWSTTLAISAFAFILAVEIVKDGPGIHVEYSDDDITYTDWMSIVDAVPRRTIFRQGDAESHRYWRVTLSGTVNPAVIGNIWLGDPQRMRKPPDGPSSPSQWERDYEVEDTHAEGGELIGRSVELHGGVLDLTFSNLDAAWVRSPWVETLVPALEIAAAYYALDIVNRPNEVAMIEAQTPIDPPVYPSTVATIATIALKGRTL